jgi:Dimerisation domain
MRVEPVPDRILEIGHAFRASKTLLSAVELGVFTALADGPLDLEALRRKVGIHARGARDFLDALVALGMLDREVDGSYINAPEADAESGPSRTVIPTHRGQHSGDRGQFLMSV